MIEGEFSPAIFFKTSSCFLAATLAVIYVIAVDLGHEPPIPKTFISACAGHYPQFIIFRIATISGSVLTTLGWLTNHFFLKSAAREKVFRIEVYHPEVGMILGMMGSMCLMGSTANIDTGIRNGKWHQRCAASFFLLTTLAIAYNTFISWIAYSKMAAITRKSMAIKVALMLMLAVQMYFSWKAGETQYSSLRSDLGNVIQWTYSLTIAAFYYSMGEDVKGFRFVYQMAGKANDKEAEVIDQNRH